MRGAMQDYEGGNMGARLMDDTRESTRRFKQGDAPAAPRTPSRAVAITTRFLADLRARNA